MGKGQWNKSQLKLKNPHLAIAYIYNNLVKGSDDFVGLVAYSIYKKEKIKYIQDFEDAHGHSPSTEELLDFHTQAQCRIEQYKELATLRVNNFYDDIYASSSVDLNKKILEAKLFGWGASIAQSVIGSILGAVAVGVLVIILLYSQYGLGWILQDTIKTYMSSLPKENTK